MANLEVSKLVKFKDFKEEQPSNILFIIVTFDVLKLVKSNVFNEEQPWNI